VFDSRGISKTPIIKMVEIRTPIKKNYLNTHFLKICLMYAPAASIEGTHMPTYKPSCCCPENQRDTENKKLRKAAPNIK
jgi:hypothetical protein